MLSLGIHLDGTWYWDACTRSDFGTSIVDRVTIERVQFVKGGYTYHYVSRGIGRVGVFPGADSDEWIEVVW